MSVPTSKVNAAVELLLLIATKKNYGVVVPTIINFPQKLVNRFRVAGVDTEYDDNKGLSFHFNAESVSLDKKLRAD